MSHVSLVKASSQENTTYDTRYLSTIEDLNESKQNDDDNDDDDGDDNKNTSSDDDDDDKALSEQVYKKFNIKPPESNNSNVDKKKDNNIQHNTAKHGERGRGRGRGKIQNETNNNYTDIPQQNHRIPQSNTHRKSPITNNNNNNNNNNPFHTFSNPFTDGNNIENPFNNTNTTTTTIATGNDLEDIFGLFAQKQPPSDQNTKSTVDVFDDMFGGTPAIEPKKNNNNNNNNKSIKKIESDGDHTSGDEGYKNGERKKKIKVKDNDEDEGEKHTSEKSSISDLENNNNNKKELFEQNSEATLSIDSNNNEKSLPKLEVPPSKLLSKRHSAPAGQIRNTTSKLAQNEKIESKENDIKLVPPTKQAPAIPTTNHDVLPELKRGTALLKYGRHGYPHFRQFNLSDDNSSLQWFTQKKKTEKSAIKLEDIDEVITGQHTKEFRRISWTTLTPASFSIIYDKRKKSLNLVAKSVDEMKMWVQSLRILRDKARKKENLSNIKELEIEIDFRDRNRPQSRRHSGNFLRSHETKEKEIDPIIHRKLIDDMANLKKIFREVSLLAQDEIVLASKEHKSINQILSELEERIEELEHEVVNTRNTKIAENDVWRTKVDIEALREKIKVLITENKKPFNNLKRRWSVF